MEITVHNESIHEVAITPIHYTSVNTENLSNPTRQTTAQAILIYRDGVCMKKVLNAANQTSPAKL
jgi:hypothetical protein